MSEEKLVFKYGLNTTTFTVIMVALLGGLIASIIQFIGDTENMTFLWVSFFLLLLAFWMIFLYRKRNTKPVFLILDSQKITIPPVGIMSQTTEVLYQEIIEVTETSLNSNRLLRISTIDGTYDIFRLNVPNRKAFKAIKAKIEKELSQRI